MTVLLALALQNAGLRTIEWELAGRTTRVLVWYPTDAREVEHAYREGRGGSTGNVAPEAEPLAGPFPLVVHSHGFTGRADGSAFLCEALARAGFVVAAADHDDLDEDSARDARPPLVRALIGRMLDEWPIDPERVGAMGHSLGGWTSIVLAGAEGRERDERVRAVLSLSGALLGYAEETVADVQVPVLLAYGELEERNDKRGTTHRAYAGLRAPKYLAELGGGDHFSFNNRGGRRGATAEHRDVLSRYAVAFFRRWLAGDASAGATLRETPPGFSLYRFEEPE